MPRHRHRPALFAALLAAVLLPRAAGAQSEPKFTFAKLEETKAGTPPPAAVEWKAQVKGGFVITGGNSQTEAGTLAASVSRKAGGNRFSLDAAAAYGRSSLPSPANIDTTTNPPTPMITALDRHTVVTTNNWLLRGRYDRFLTTNNSAYASGQAAADKIAGKAFLGGGQVGYSRQLLKNGSPS
jgi:hypothetical protein